MIKRIPLVYPETPGDVSPEEFKSKIREIHQEYCKRMLQLEMTTTSLAKECEEAYRESIGDYINSVGC